MTNMNKKYYNFPKGKVNEGEAGHKCAVREVWEEIGIDIRELIKENCYLEYSVKKEFKTMYVVPGVNEQYKFSPNHDTRGEIGSIVWMTLRDFELRANEDRFSLIKPFLRPLKLFIEQYRKKTSPPTARDPLLPGDGDTDTREVQQRMEDLFNKSQNLHEGSPDPETRSQAKSTDEIDPPLIIKVTSSGLASCPEGSLDGEGASSGSDTEDVHSRIERRVQVFAEELEKKFVAVAASLKQTLEGPPTASGTLGPNPFKEEFRLMD